MNVRFRTGLRTQILDVTRYHVSLASGPRLFEGHLGSREVNEARALVTIPRLETHLAFDQLCLRRFMIDMSAASTSGN